MTEHEHEYAERPNKTQIKREIKALHDLGKQLTQLPDGHLKKIPLSDEMREVIADAKRFTKGALQRQMRRMANLMRDEDVESIQTELTRLQQSSKQQVHIFHELEQWRDQLIEGNDALLTELIERFPDIDRQYIRQLIRNAQNEQKKNSPPKSARLLFKYLSEIHKA